MSFRCLFLDPHLTIYHSNVGVQIIYMLELGMSTSFLFQVFLNTVLFIYLFIYMFFPAVARTLREMAESKAHAQEEVVHWKNKYEMERLRNAKIEHVVAPDHTSLGK